jgi:tRNA dimethylallyltransferase
MFEDGFVEEVRSLLANGYGKEIPAFESLGYLEIIRYLEGEFDLETVQQEIQRTTRAYAKRQMTWFRRDTSYHWIEVTSTCVDRIIAEWFAFLDGGEESR